jgi:hypothetical protein
LEVVRQGEAWKCPDEAERTSGYAPADRYGLPSIRHDIAGDRMSRIPDAARRDHETIGAGQEFM